MKTRCACGSIHDVRFAGECRADFFASDTLISILAFEEKGAVPGTAYGKDFEAAGVEEQAARVADHFAELTSRNFSDAIAMRILRASVEGQTPDQIVAAVRKDAPEMARKNAETWVQTVESWIYNKARLQEIKDDPFVSKVRFLAILDEATTQICQRLNGRVFDKSDPNIQAVSPPLHFNCRSQLQPISDFSSRKYPEPEKTQKAIKEINEFGEPAFVAKTNLLDESLFDRAPRSEWAAPKVQKYKDMTAAVLSVAQSAGLKQERADALQKEFDKIADMKTDSEKIDGLGRVVQDLRKGIDSLYVDDVAQSMIDSGFLNLRNWGDIGTRGTELIERASASDLNRQSSEVKEQIKQDVRISEGGTATAGVKRNRWGLPPRLIEVDDPIRPKTAAPYSEKPTFSSGLIPLEIQKAIASYTTGRYKYIRKYWQTGTTKSDGVRAVGDIIKLALDGYKGDVNGKVFRGLHLGNSEAPAPAVWERFFNAKPGQAIQIDDQPTSWDRRESVAGWFSKRWDRDQRSVVFELDQKDPGFGIRPLSYYRDWQTEVLKPGVKMQIESSRYDPKTKTLYIKGKEL